MHRSIIKVTTSVWYDKGGVHHKRSYSYRKRLSVGDPHILEWESEMVGGDVAFEKITNPNVKDGLYEVRIINPQHDWETGNLEDYDFELVPYENA